MEYLALFAFFVLGSIAGTLLIRPAIEAVFTLSARLGRLSSHDRREATRSAPTGEADRLRARMMRLARTTLLLVPTNAPGVSKLGGDPELPVGAEWPRNANGALAFVAQLDLAEIRDAGGHDWLPEAGVLHAFNDEQRYGFPDHVRVLFSAGCALAPRVHPSDLAPRLQYAERRVGFVPLRSFPSLDWLGLDPAELDIDDDELDRLADAPGEPFGDEVQHRIGGYPSDLQSSRMALECEHVARGLPAPVEGQEVPPAIERASKSWRLLLQVDSDPALGMSWGGGRLYVFVREAHARAGNFSKTVALSQTD
jgi:uncharacterized protein YwqG